MPSGRLKKYINEKRFGFITPDDGSPDIFAHSQQFNGYADGLRGGERVMFEIDWDEAKQKYRATTWTLDPSAASSLKSGTIKTYFPDKGFGFIAPDEGGDNLFAHFREFRGDSAEMVKEGDRVKFDAAWDDRRGKMKAALWQIDMDGAMGMPGQAGMNSQYSGCSPGGGYGPMGNNFGTPQSSPYGAGGMAGGKGGMGGMGAMAPGGMQGAAPCAGGSASLPPGWEQMPDPATGRMYYCNRSTGESSWDPPAAVPPPPAPAAGVMALPPGWEEAKDPSSGKSYYFNRSTGETRWDPPQY